MNEQTRNTFEKVVTLSSLLPRLRDIPRMQTPSPETFRNYIAPVGLPVIFTDMLEGEKLNQWTWEYVRSKWGKKVCSNTRQGELSTAKTTPRGKYRIKYVTVTLEDFLDVATGKREVKDDEKLYVTKEDIISVEDLEEEFSYPPFYPGDHQKCYVKPKCW